MRSCDRSWNTRTDNLGTDFWGPVSNFGIPIAAIADMSKDPEMYVFKTCTHCRYSRARVSYQIVIRFSTFLLTQSQYLRPYDWCPDALLRHLHALCARCVARKLPTLRLPRYQLHLSARPGLQIYQPLPLWRERGAVERQGKGCW